MCGIVAIRQWFEVTGVVKNSVVHRKSLQLPQLPCLSSICFCISELKCKHERCLRALWNQFYFWVLSLHYCAEWHMVRVYVLYSRKVTHKHALVWSKHSFRAQKKNANVFVIKNICCVSLKLKAFCLFCSMFAAENRRILWRNFVTYIMILGIV